MQRACASSPWQQVMRTFAARPDRPAPLSTFADSQQLIERVFASTTNEHPSPHPPREARRYPVAFSYRPKYHCRSYQEKPRSAASCIARELLSVRAVPSRTLPIPEPILRASRYGAGRILQTCRRLLYRARSPLDLTENSDEGRLRGHTLPHMTATRRFWTVSLAEKSGREAGIGPPC